MTTKSVLIAGSGGQGVLLLGKLLAHGAMLAAKNVTWFPSYGAEMRGGSANCTVIISDDMIGSPIIRNPDITVVFNEASKERFMKNVKKGGVLIMDNSLIKSVVTRNDIRTVAVPATQMASEMGNPKSANMVMLGALLAENILPEARFAITALEELTPPKIMKNLAVNKEAVEKGMKYCADKKRIDS